MKTARITDLDFAAYRRWGHFNLFQIACFIHRLDPDRFHQEIMGEFLDLEREMDPTGYLKNANELFVAKLNGLPQVMLGDEVGQDLAALKKASGGRSAYFTLPASEAPGLVSDIGRTWPDELRVPDATKPAPAEQTPPPEPVQAAPAIQPRALKRAALIAELQGEWPSIKNDLSDASRNGLDAAKLAQQHGMWNPDVAMEWAKSRGKLAQQRTGMSPATWCGPITRHQPR